METNWELEVFKYEEDGKEWIKMRKCTFDYMLAHASAQAAEVALSTPEISSAFVDSFKNATTKEY